MKEKSYSELNKHNKSPEMAAKTILHVDNTLP
jgi:hypothetical protein